MIVIRKLTIFVSEKIRQIFVGLNFHAGQSTSPIRQDSQRQPILCVCETTDQNNLVSRIVAMMEKERVFKNPRLDLRMLSGALETPSYIVTKALNEELGVSFYELVNMYRVAEVKHLLVHTDSSRFTLLSLAFEAGFNSKTTFNTVFKKTTGVTPSSFRAAQKCLTKVKTEQTNAVV